MNRRTFSQTLSALLSSAALAVLAVVPAAAHLLGPLFKKKEAGEEWVDLGPVADFSPDRPNQRVVPVTKIDGWQTRVQNQVVFVVFKETEPQVLSSICPHLKCGVVWEGSETAFVCHCHATYFDPQGVSTKGPSPRSMDPLPSKVEDGNLLCRWANYRSAIEERVEV